MTTYFALGTTHILLGLDHVLFVTALALLVRERGRLVQSVTAFSIGHTASMSLVVLGAASVPRLAETAIAASVMFAGIELYRVRRGASSVVISSPWLACGAIGILHGLGFAGALEALALPAAEVPVALALFTIGLELGQLTIIGGVLLLVAAWRRVAAPGPRWAADAPALGIASIALFWLVGTLL